MDIFLLLSCSHSWLDSLYTRQYRDYIRDQIKISRSFNIELEKEWNRWFFLLISLSLFWIIDSERWCRCIDQISVQLITLHENTIKTINWVSVSVLCMFVFFCCCYNFSISSMFSLFICSLLLIHSVVIIGLYHLP